MATAQIRLERNKVRNFISYGRLTPAGIISVMKRTSISQDRDVITKNSGKLVTTKNDYVSSLATAITINNTLVTIPVLGQPTIDAITSFITTAINNIVPNKRNTIKVALVVEQSGNTTTASLLITTVNGDIKSVSNITVLSSNVT